MALHDYIVQCHSVPLKCSLRLSEHFSVAYRTAAFSLVSKRQLWDTLAVKVKHVTEMEKDCVLVFDEMAMKRKLAYNNVYGTYFG